MYKINNKCHYNPFAITHVHQIKKANSIIAHKSWLFLESLCRGYYKLRYVEGFIYALSEESKQAKTKIPKDQKNEEQEPIITIANSEDANTENDSRSSLFRIKRLESGL